MLIEENLIRALVKKALIEASLSNIRGKFSSKSRRSSSDTSSDEDVDIGSLKDLKYVSLNNEKSADIALEEFDFWEKGKKKENKNDQETNDKLKSYWDAANYKYPSPNVWEEPWSAAFISFVMKNSNENDFPFSAAHTTWAKKALDNRKELAKDIEKFVGKEMLVLFRREEVEPKKGDLVFRLRKGGDINDWLGNPIQSPSHSDVFIGNNKAIGGNLSDSVSETKFNHPIVIKKIKVTGKN